VALLFARGVSDGLIGLIEKIDEEIYGKKGEPQGFVVFLAPKDEALKKRLAEIAAAKGLRIPLTISESGEKEPRGYVLAPDAFATVVLYEERNVKAAFAFRKDELNEAAAESVRKAIREHFDLR
jgi:hypothetical protein